MMKCSLSLYPDVLSLITLLSHNTLIEHSPPQRQYHLTHAPFDTCSSLLISLLPLANLFSTCLFSPFDIIEKIEYWWKKFCRATK